jgi:hypothetical protein
VLKYNKYILDADAKTFAMKVGSNIGETIEITFLDPFYPPFDDKTPEIVRMAMAKNGLLLTRVLGNDYIDPDL